MSLNKVTPLAGVWIEIVCDPNSIINSEKSLPLRECGLKWEEGF